MEIIIDRPYADYAKDIGRICEQINRSEQLDASVFYTGYLDGLNNPYVLEWLQHPQVSSVCVIVANDYLTNGSAHAVNWAGLAAIHKKFVIVTEVANADQDFELPDNIQMVHMGPTLVAEPRYYVQVRPQVMKTMLTGPHWICLNRSTRPQRMLLAAVLADLELGVNSDSRGLLKIDGRNHGTRWAIADYKNWRDLMALSIQHVVDYDQLMSWSIDVDHEQRLSRGWHMIWDNCHTVQDHSDYVDNLGQNLNNHQNFDQRLRKYYQSAVIELVPETLYFTQGQLVSEKFTNSVMGFCLPIMLAAAGTVAYLRDLGFDMFDDVIDHSYDLVSDPVRRAFELVERNQHLLRDPVQARMAWLKSWHRLEANYQRITSGLLRQQCADQFRADYTAAIRAAK
jgi:hypothetical protein